MRARILTSAAAAAAADAVIHLELDAAGSDLYGIADCSTLSVRRCECKTKYDDGRPWAPRRLFILLPLYCFDLRVLHI